jgi:hypothetical protein
MPQAGDARMKSTTSLSGMCSQISRYDILYSRAWTGPPIERLWLVSMHATLIVPVNIDEFWSSVWLTSQRPHRCRTLMPYESAWWTDERRSHLNTLITEKDVTALGLLNLVRDAHYRDECSNYGCGVVYAIDRSGANTNLDSVLAYSKHKLKRCVADNFIGGVFQCAGPTYNPVNMYLGDVSDYRMLKDEGKL